MKSVVDNVEAAIKYIEDAEKIHPNRHDVCDQRGSTSQPTSTVQPASTIGQGNGFGQTSYPGLFGQSTSSAGSGQPSTFGNLSQSTGFSQPSFGQPSFGQPTQTSGGGPPAFGAPSLGSSGGSFGKPSLFGHASQPTSTLGQPAQPAAFGQSPQPSGFGQPSFGQPTVATPANSFTGGQQPISTFGQHLNPSVGFVQPAFGQASQPTGFGQSSQPVNQAPSAVGSASPSASGNPFAQPSLATPLFGTASNTTRAPAFGQPNFPSDHQSNAFQASRLGSSGNAQPTNVATAPSSGSGRHVPMTYAQTLPPGPTNRDGSKRLTMFRSRRVKYIAGVPHYDRPDGQGWERIWFPDGPPHISAQEVDGLPAQYTDAVMEQWRYVLEHGNFQNGRMPEVPPLREWASHDF